MKTLELNQMEVIHGEGAFACGFAIGVGLAAIPALGPWGLVIAFTLACGTQNAY